MSAYDDGKCDHCSKANLRATVKIQIHDISGTLGNETGACNAFGDKETKTLESSPVSGLIHS